MARRAVLIAQEQFSAFGKDFGIGMEVPDAEVQKWPKGTLENRVRNGFVKYGAEDDITSEAPTQLDGAEIEGDNSEGDKEEGKGAGIEAPLAELRRDARAPDEFAADMMRHRSDPDGSELIGDNSEGDKAEGKITGVGVEGGDDVEEALDEAEKAARKAKREARKARAEELNGMTKAQLVEMAHDDYGETLSLTSSKDVLVKKILGFEDAKAAATE